MHMILTKGTRDKHTRVKLGQKVKGQRLAAHLVAWVDTWSYTRPETEVHQIRYPETKRNNPCRDFCFVSIRYLALFRRKIWIRQASCARFIQAVNDMETLIILAITLFVIWYM